MAQVTSPKTHCVQLHLAARREKAGVSLEDIVLRTKITPRFLRAIEDENFQLLPGGIFTTSYIRQYADALGLDVEELLACYHASMPASEASDEPARKPPTAQESFPGRLLRAALRFR